jgi:drug/metabolite transporter (DMT)-like permease
VTLALIWGSAFLWIKLSLKGFSPVQLTWARLTLGAAVLIAVLALSSRTLPHQAHLWKRLAVAALLGNAIPYLLFGIAEQQVSSSLAGAVNATTPLWTLTIALAVRAQPALGTLRLIGLVLGFLGTLTILAPWEDLGRGYHVGALLCLAASASYGASYVYVGRFLSNTGLSSVVLSAGQLTAAAGWLTLSLPAGGLTVPAWRAEAVTALGILGILGTGAAYVLNYRIIADDGALLASTVTYLLPVVAVILGTLVLDEPLTLRMTAGVIVVLLGVVLTRRQAPRQVPAMPSPATE